jgi:hypothetical protein
MSTLQKLKNSLGIDSQISKLISNTEPGIDSISEVYQALYELHQQSTTALEELELQISELSLGITGSQGIQGIEGSQGMQGIQGIQGIDGSQGIQGIDGSQGIQGIQGINGSDGSTGSTGATGSSFIPVLNPSEIFRGQTHRNNSTTIDIYGGSVMSTTASTLAQSVTTTTFATKHIRLRYYASVVSTGRYTGVRGSAQQFWSINGGFRYICDFNISDTSYSSTTQQFYGLGAYNTDLNYGGSSVLLVSSLTNIIGIGNDSGDSNLQVIYNDGSGIASKIDLGSSFPANRTSGAASITIYSIQLYNEPGTNSVLYEVTNKETGDIAHGTLTTNLPASSLLLNFFASRSMGSGGGVTNSGQFDLLKLGVYSPL